MLVNCQTCGTLFNKDPYRMKKCKTHFCSNECTKTGAYITCQHCGNQFYAIQATVKDSSKGKYCSKSCVHASFKYRYANENGPSWRGDKVKYVGLHVWVSKKLSKPSKCEHCGTTNAPRFEWANKSGKYLRSLEDWMRLCKKCHNDYDGVNAWQQVARQVG